jgi:hypothetical protein
LLLAAARQTKLAIGAPVVRPTDEFPGSDGKSNNQPAAICSATALAGEAR